MAYSQPFPLAQPIQKVQQPTFGPDLAVRLICPECRDPNPNIVEEFSSGDLVCGTCGLVLGDRIVDTRSEWRVSHITFYYAPASILWAGSPHTFSRRSQTTRAMTLRVLERHLTLSWRAWNSWTRPFRSGMVVLA